MKASAPASTLSSNTLNPKPKLKPVPMHRLDNSDIECWHGRLDPGKAGEMKRISEVSPFVGVRSLHVACCVFNRAPADIILFPPFLNVVCCVRFLVLTKRYRPGTSRWSIALSVS